MPEPTLTELREIADELVQHCDLVAKKTGGLSMVEEYGRRVATAFLSLTDQTPLNVIQTQALGLEQDDENEHEYIEADNPTSMLTVMMGRDHTAVSMNIGDPTLGMLRLALMQERRDGE